MRNTAIVECLDYRVYERYFEIEKGDVLIDVGAGIGEFTILAGVKVGNEGCVLAIEPEPRNFAYLKTNVKLNKLKNVKLCRKAIAEYKGRAKLYVLDNGCTGHSLIPRKRAKAIEVEVDTLDNVVNSYALDKIDFIKVNVEGAEVNVIKGGRKVLGMARKVVIECHGAYNVTKIIRILKALGFKVWLYGDIVYGFRKTV